MLKANFWFTTKLTDAVEKKFQSKVHHHKNVVKSAQHHRLAPGALPQDTLTVVKRRNLVSFINYALDLFQVEFSHLYNPQTMKFMLIAHILLVSNTNRLELHFCPSQSTSTSPQRSSSRYMWGKTIFYLSGTQNLFKQSPILTYTHASTSGTLSFAKERSSLPKSCLGSLYLANPEVIQLMCRFKVAKASEKIFELAENTGAVYSTGTINTN